MADIEENGVTKANFVYFNIELLVNFRQGGSSIFQFLLNLALKNSDSAKLPNKLTVV